MLRTNQPQYTSNTYVKKCSYFLAIIKIDKFKELGAQKLKDTNVYFIERKYDGSSTGETCAVIGFNKYDTISLLNDDDNNIVHKIKKSDELKHIDLIEELSTRLIENTVKYFSVLISDLLDKDELILLNIEPKGQTRRQLKFYPTPNLSIPGGNMEYEDEWSIEKCGEREFLEETGIDITNSYKIISRNTKPLLKIYSNDNKKNYPMSFPNYSNFKKNSKKTVRIEKYFFLIKIF